MRNVSPSLSGHSLFLDDTRYERADPNPRLQKIKLQASVVKLTHPLPRTLQLEQLRIFTPCVTQVDGEGDEDHLVASFCAPAQYSITLHTSAQH